MLQGNFVHCTASGDHRQADAAHQAPNTQTHEVFEDIVGKFERSLIEVRRDCWADELPANQQRKRQNY
jgi:hypothetical protein